LSGYFPQFIKRCYLQQKVQVNCITWLCSTEESQDFIKMDFRGKKMKGIWAAEREEGSKIWTLKRGSVPTTLTFSAPFNLGMAQDTNEGLLIKDVCLLGVGSWKGGSMEYAVYHSADYISQLYELMPDPLPLCAEHSCYPGGTFDPERSFGKIFNKRLSRDGDLHGDILVTDDEQIKLVRSGHYKGVSFNADAFVCPDRRVALNPTKAKEGSLVTDPACKVCYLPGCGSN